MPQIINAKPGDQFIYHGPGDGQGEVHSVTSADAATVTTWSRGDSQMTWIGSPAEFKEQFHEIGATPPLDTKQLPT